MADILLPFAYDENSDEYVHISERISAKFHLICPQCKQAVIAKKGQINRHHFAHKHESTCSITKETALHEGAKYYLKNKLERDEPITIQCSQESIFDSKAKAMLNTLGINEFSILSNRFFNSEQNDFTVEKKIPGTNMIPDMLAVQKHSVNHQYWGWEIYVSHEVDEEKTKKYQQNGIPFIELIPEEKGKSDYKFTLRTYSGFELMKGSDHWYSDYTLLKKKEEIIGSEIHETLLKESFETIVTKLRRLNEHDLEESHLDFEDYFLPAIKSCYTTTIYNKEYGFGFNFSNSIRCKKINHYKSGKFWNIKFNNRYSSVSSFELLGRLLVHLGERDMTGGLISDQDKLVGVEFWYPSLKTEEMIKTEIMLPEERSWGDSESIYDYKIKRGRYGQFLTINNRIVKSPEHLLSLILNYFLKHFELTLILGKEKNSRYERVIGIEIKGLVDETRYRRLLFDAHIPYLINKTIDRMKNGEIHSYLENYINTQLNGLV